MVMVTTVGGIMACEMVGECFLQMISEGRDLFCAQIVL